MRQVVRTQTPGPLVNPGVAVAALSATGQIDTTVYGHEDVRGALRRMYLDKCYLCESYLGARGQVEHFLPWDQSAPGRAYDWNNLHWSCAGCNARKRRKEYRIPARGTAQRTELIDPSSPPTGCRIEDLLMFGRSGKAVSIAKLDQPRRRELADRTAEFLNESQLFAQRVARLMDMLGVVAHHGSAPTWRTICSDARIDLDTWIEPERTRRLEALDHADALYGTFLLEGQAFSTCMRHAVFEHVRLSTDDFARMSIALRKFKGLPILG